MREDPNFGKILTFFSSRNMIFITELFSLYILNTLINFVVWFDMMICMKYVYYIYFIELTKKQVQ